MMNTDPSGHSGRHSTIDKSALWKHAPFPPPVGSGNTINVVSRARSENQRWNTHFDTIGPTARVGKHNPGRSQQ